MFYRDSNHHPAESGAKGHEEVGSPDADGSDHQEVHFRSAPYWGWPVRAWEETATKVSFWVLKTSIQDEAKVS